MIYWGISGELRYIDSVPKSGKTVRKETSELIKALNGLLKSGELEPYIRHIRFPYYKDFLDDSRIDFSFPITILAGQNGTNKSSVLRALYGCCPQRSLGRLWFSSETDYIPDRDKKSMRYIYGYFDKSFSIDVEVLQNRRRRDDDPDYWETSRPSKLDGMKHSRADVHEITGSKKQRWEKIDKPCELIDFRSEISAFDRFFYHSNLKSNDHFPDKRAFIRDRSKYIKDTLEKGESSTYKWGRNEWKIDLIDLPSEELEEINWILDRDYSGIRILRHNLFRFSGDSISILNPDGTSYTEAFSGSGEYSIIHLVHKTYALEDHSLLLMDEPEVSLHPSAQERLINFLCGRAISHKLQIVISTHSPHMVKDMPNSAIKVFYRSGDKVKIAHDCSANEAFFYIARHMTRHFRIFCEDKLSQYMLNFFLEKTRGESFASQFEINYLPGGAEQIINNQISPASQRRDEIFFILDGDKKKAEYFLNPEDIPSSENNKLDQIIKDSVGCSVKFSLNSNDEAGSISARRRFLEYIRTNLYYLPFLNPERFLIDLSKDSDAIAYRNNSEGKNGKGSIKDITNIKLGRDSGSATSEEIFVIQKLLVASINLESQEVQDILSIFDKIAKSGS